MTHMLRMCVDNMFVIYMPSPSNIYVHTYKHTYTHIAYRLGALSFLSKSTLRVVVGSVGTGT